MQNVQFSIYSLLYPHAMNTCCMLPLQESFPTLRVSLFTVSPQKGWQVREKQGYPMMWPWREKADAWAFLLQRSNLCLVLTSYKEGGKINSLYNICIVFRIANIYKKQQGKYRMQISISVSASKQPKMAWKFGGHGLSEYGSRSGLLGAGSLCKSYKINKRL